MYSVVLRSPPHAVGCAQHETLKRTPGLKLLWPDARRYFLSYLLCGEFSLEYGAYRIYPYVQSPRHPDIVFFNVPLVSPLFNLCSAFCFGFACFCQSSSTTSRVVNDAGLKMSTPTLRSLLLCLALLCLLCVLAWSGLVDDLLEWSK